MKRSAMDLPGGGEMAINIGGLTLEEAARAAGAALLKARDKVRECNSGVEFAKVAAVDAKDRLRRARRRLQEAEAAKRSLVKTPGPSGALGAAKQAIEQAKAEVAAAEEAVERSDRQLEEAKSSLKAARAVARRLSGHAQAAAEIENGLL